VRACEGDLPQATQNADQITNDAFPLGLLARALAASAPMGSTARRSTRSPGWWRCGWRSDTRGELRKFFREPSILERLAHDLAAAGLSG
jgi:hypothetical protein